MGLEVSLEVRVRDEEGLEFGVFLSLPLSIHSFPQQFLLSTYYASETCNVLVCEREICEPGFPYCAAGQAGDVPEGRLVWGEGM